MAMFVACYDLNDTNKPHGDFLAAAIASGWSQWVLANDKKWYKLPNTTIRGDFTDHDTAMKSFHSIKPAAEKSLGKKITLEKYFVTAYTHASLDSDVVRNSKP